VLGVNACGRAPGEVPDLDTIEPGLGITDPAQLAAKLQEVERLSPAVYRPRWRLAGWPFDATCWALAQGLDIETDQHGRLWAVSSRAWARSRLHQLLDEVAEVKARTTALDP
jgi:hypothetical protein